MTRLRLGEIEVARIGLGTNRLSKTPEHVELIREAVTAGVQLVDTAHTYAGGQSEETIGTALVPDRCVVATKGGWNGARPEVLRVEIAKSLRRLRTETIGLYYLHRPDPETSLEESLGAIKEHQDAGQIRNVGVSNVGIAQIERARDVVRIAAVQNPYSVSDRRHDDVVDYCTREGIVFVPYFPLRGTGGGALTEIAERRGATQAQVALAWLLKRSPAILPIPGSLSIEHVKENLAAPDLKLSDAEFDALL
jgi:aryl-alcohol dehydrogenase-like predicted oxidoreductase